MESTGDVVFMVNDIVEIFIHLGFEHVKIAKFYYYDLWL